MYRNVKDDPGLYLRAKQNSDQGKVHSPSLRYTKYTCPCMHNGMLETLRDVVEVYNAGGGESKFSANKTKAIQPLSLEDGEIDDPVAFHKSLSGDDILPPEPEAPEMQPLPMARN
jgi:cytochrome c peroxidase